jgi:predicted small metal-binding protein
MARKYIDCRDHSDPSASEQCTVAISADTEEEVIDATAQHVVHAHAMRDTPDLREQLRESIKEGMPPD